MYTPPLAQAWKRNRNPCLASSCLGLLGHHSPSFTLSRYAHLIPGDSAPTLDLDAELTSKLSADGARISRNQPEADLAEALVSPANHGLGQNQPDSAGIVVTSS